MSYTEYLIELQDVTYSYPYSKQAISDIYFSARNGEKIAIVGPNGAGKSTLLLTLNATLIPESGTIRYQGIPLSYDKKTLRMIRQKVGFVFQNPDTQIIAPTVWQDVAFGPVNLEIPDDQVAEIVRDALRHVGLEGFDRRPPYHLSGGEKKRVAIAGILAMNPDILIFDEPTSMLDPAGSEDIMDLLDELNNQGKTIIISTHDVELAYPWADRIILMNKGKIIAEGTPEKAFSDRELVRQARLRSPVILDLYREMQARGMAECSRLPRTVLDMIRLIEQDHHGVMRLSTSGCGTIHLIDVDRISSDGITRLLAGSGIRTIGAMGSKAKITARHWGIMPDFTYAVIDKCILGAMNGKSSLILTSGGMVNRVFDRVSGFNQENNRSIQVVHGQEITERDTHSDNF